MNKASLRNRLTTATNEGVIEMKEQELSRRMLSQVCGGLDIRFSKSSTKLFIDSVAGNLDATVKF